MKKVVAVQTKGKYSRQSIKNNYERISVEFGEFEQMFKKGEKILIKPNFVAPSERAATDLCLLECVLSTLLQIGAEPIVAESSGFEFSTEDTFRILGVDKLCERLGIKLLNLDFEEFKEIPSGNPFVPTYKLPKLIFEVDKIINMPRLKGHSLTKVTFSIKNLFGLLHRESRRKIHATDLEQGIRCLKKLIPVDFIIVDGLWNLTNAVYSDSQYQGIIVAGNDMTAVDYCCCKIFGVDYKTIPHIYDVGEKIDFEYKELSVIESSNNNVAAKEHYEKQCRKYKTMYTVDLFFSKLTGMSLIPYIHFYLGIRPYINRKKCNGCNKCEAVCPVDAIHDMRIEQKRCMKVRCMKCYDLCPIKAVEKKGFHK